MVDQLAIGYRTVGFKALVAEKLHRISLAFPDVYVHRGFPGNFTGQMFDKTRADSPPPAEGAGDDLVDQKLLSRLVGVNKHIPEDFTLLDPDVAVGVVLLDRRVVDKG